MQISSKVFEFSALFSLFFNIKGDLEGENACSACGSVHTWKFYQVPFTFSYLKLNFQHKRTKKCGKTAKKAQKNAKQLQQKKGIFLLRERKIGVSLAE